MKKQLSVNSIVFRLSMWLVVILILFATAAALLSDYKKVLLLLGSVSVSWLLLIFAAVLFNYALRFVKWHFFLRQVGISVPLKTSLWVFFSAFTMVLSPAKIGELVKAVLLESRLGVPVARTAPVVLAERLTDLLGLLILCAFGFSRFAFGGRTLILSGLLIIAGIIALTRPSFWQALEKIIAGFRRLDRLRQTVQVVQQSTRDLLSFKSLLFTVPLSAISWAGEGVALYLIFLSMGLDLPNLLGISIFAHAFGSIAGALSFLPGGLLVTEGAMGMFFVFVLIPDTIAVSATFLIRAVTLWFAVILGTVVFVAGHQQADLRFMQTGDSHDLEDKPAESSMEEKILVE